MVLGTTGRHESELTHGVCLGVQAGPGHSWSLGEALQVAASLRGTDERLKRHTQWQCEVANLLAGDRGEVLWGRRANHVQDDVHLVQVCRGSIHLKPRALRD